ncbi:uncharacterized protein FYW61_018978 [Anableps anableps]
MILRELFQEDFHIPAPYARKNALNLRIGLLTRRPTYTMQAATAFASSTLIGMGWCHHCKGMQLKVLRLCLQPPHIVNKKTSVIVVPIPAQTAPAVPAQEIEVTNLSVVLIPARTVHVIGGAQKIKGKNPAMVLLHTATTTAQKIDGTKQAAVQDIEKTDPAIAPVLIAPATTAQGMESTNLEVDQDIEKTDPAIAPVLIAPATTVQEIEETNPTVVLGNTDFNATSQGLGLVLAPHAIIALLALVIDHVQEAMGNTPHQRE